MSVLKVVGIRDMKRPGENNKLIGLASLSTVVGR